MWWKKCYFFILNKHECVVRTVKLCAYTEIQFSPFRRARPSLNVQERGRVEGVTGGKERVCWGRWVHSWPERTVRSPCAGLRRGHKAKSAGTSKSTGKKKRKKKSKNKFTTVGRCKQAQNKKLTRCCTKPQKGTSVAKAVNKGAWLGSRRGRNSGGWKQEILA